MEAEGYGAYLDQVGRYEDIQLTEERAVPAGGCFWGLQGLIRQIGGVFSQTVTFPTRPTAIMEPMPKPLRSSSIPPRSATRGTRREVFFRPPSGTFHSGIRSVLPICGNVEATAELHTTTGGMPVRGCHDGISTEADGRYGLCCHNA